MHPEIFLILNSIQRYEICLEFPGKLQNYGMLYAAACADLRRDLQSALPNQHLYRSEWVGQFNDLQYRAGHCRDHLDWTASRYFIFRWQKFL